MTQTPARSSRLATVTMLFVATLFLFGFGEGGCGGEEPVDPPPPPATQEPVKGACVAAWTGFNICYPDTTEQQCKDFRKKQASMATSFHAEQTCPDQGCTYKCKIMSGHDCTASKCNGF